ncbi:MAG: atuC [Alphaproteobacteria bacterium]|jgi:geranyl-CoA carboxylase beta subunit|nr:atuC [Alphaproteobacteria bacterium]
MPVFDSRIDAGSPEFAANRAAMLDLIAGFRTLEQRIRDLSAAKRAQFVARNQLLPCEWLALSLDRDRIPRARPMPR